MKKSKKILLIISIIIGLLILLIGFVKLFLNTAITINNDENAIKRIINKKYYSYAIREINLEYVDFYSTVRTADKFNRATRATVIIEKDNSQITVRFRRFLLVWYLYSAKSDYGNGIADDIYFVEVKYNSVGKAVDIDKYITDNNLWIIPEKDGSLYKKIKSEDDWYYSIKFYDNIYKTDNGKIYFFNKKDLNWDLSDKKYSDLCYYANYTRINKESANEIILKYSSTLK